jgi:hypothetical protein
MLAVAAVGGVALLVGFRPSASSVEWLAAAGLLTLITVAVTWPSVVLALTAKTVEAAQERKEDERHRQVARSCPRHPAGPLAPTGSEANRAPVHPGEDTEAGERVEVRSDRRRSHGEFHTQVANSHVGTRADDVGDEPTTLSEADLGEGWRQRRHRPGEVAARAGVTVHVIVSSAVPSGARSYSGESASSSTSRADGCRSPRDSGAAVGYCIHSST